MCLVCARQPALRSHVARHVSSRLVIAPHGARPGHPEVSCFWRHTSAFLIAKFKVKRKNLVLSKYSLDLSTNIIRRKYKHSNALFWSIGAIHRNAARHFINMLFRKYIYIFSFSYPFFVHQFHGRNSEYVNTECLYVYKVSSSLEALTYNHHNFLSLAARQREGKEWEME